MLNKCIRPTVKNIGNTNILEISKLYYLFNKQQTYFTILYPNLSRHTGFLSEVRNESSIST